MSLSPLQQALEALFFATNAPLTLRKLHQFLVDEYECEKKDIKEAIEMLQEKYQQERHAFELTELAGGYLLQSKSEFFPIIQKLNPTKPARLSNAALEILSIIAYKQPVTKAEIEGIRGVDSSHALTQLLERELVCNDKKLEAPGQPSLYETTSAFLEYFGLSHLKDLPPLPEEATLS